MDETHRTLLIQAISFAEVFCQMAHHEIEGAPSLYREAAQENLEAALNILSGKEVSFE